MHMGVLFMPGMAGHDGGRYDVCGAVFFQSGGLGLDVAHWDVGQPCCRFSRAILWVEYQRYAATSCLEPAALGYISALLTASLSLHGHRLASDHGDCLGRLLSVP